MKTIELNEILTDVWIETYKEMLPDFIACDKGNEIYKRKPLKKYIPVKRLLGKLKELYDSSNAILWNKFAGSKFFDRIQTTLFSNVAAFEVLLDNQKIDTGEFRSLWSELVMELFKKYF